MNGNLVITDDGKMYVDSYRSISRAILNELLSGPKKVFDLISRIRENYHEFKYLKVELVIKTVKELIDAKLVRSTYKRERV